MRLIAATGDSSAHGTTGVCPDSSTSEHMSVLMSGSFAITRTVLRLGSDNSHLRQLGGVGRDFPLCQRNHRSTAAAKSRMCCYGLAAPAFTVCGAATYSLG